MLTSCGSPKTSVKIVDSFCEGKYFSQSDLLKSDFDNFAEIRANEKHKVSIDKLIRNLTVNEKEFKQCQNSAKPQPQN